jgi:hypothetical protein
MKILNGTRFKSTEIQAYRHVYVPANGLTPEVSYVLVEFKQGGSIKILPTETLHSDAILTMLDALTGATVV